MSRTKKHREPFVMLPLSLLTSLAWRSLSLNARRFVEFLMIEHMRHGGKANGKLLAPRRQLEQFGIGSHFISSAIEECEHIGLVNVRRGVGRRPSLYALTWLPLCDGSEPSNGFLRRDDAAQAIIAAKKVAKLRKSFKKPVLATVQTALATNDCTNSSQADCQTAVTKPVATVQTAVTKMGAKQQSPSRKLLTTATPKGVWESGYGDTSAASGEPDGRDVPIRDQPNPGKPNGRNHCNVVIPLLRTRTAE